ncbi:MAG: xanthine dehydrogenase family protein molybdopterin-binding subunit [Rhodospirillum sp.]|nr:xanthine dehydrogenase family protein molybdopterin-binding subunit [Rhodospirillum sp.]MCF8488634.1 xanthine dehydrogenase family protein molybdopterin-binding subunit [Rhodospirillum sp.]
MGRFGAGQAMRRVEDQRFLTGQGRYTDDITYPNSAHLAVLRSPYAHAEITALDVTEARAAPGVIAVLTEADLTERKIADLPVGFMVTSGDGTPMAAPPRPALARGRVRYVGQPVVAVIAETPNAARDALELIEVAFDPLDAVGDLTAATAEGAPVLWESEAPGNILYDWEMGEREATDAAFARAARVVSIELVNGRIAPTSIEGRAAQARVDETGRLELITGNQGAHNLRDVIAGKVLNIPKDQLHVLCPDVGGGFGMKIFLYPEHILVLLGAMVTQRPVKWAADRSESFQADVHGRDHLTRAELALDADGRYLALRVDTLANMGAYVSHFGAFIPTAAGTGMLPGVYAIPALHARVRGVMTNTAPTDAYRGAGRPEAAYVIERLTDKVARELGFSPAEIRRRNFIPPEAMPYSTAGGKVYDSGEFAAVLDTALARADWDGFDKRKADSAAKGLLRGRGLSYYVEVCAGGAPETATLVMDETGGATILIGTQSNGQGHETAYTQMAADALGLPPERITVVQGDTDRIATGGGTGGSRSIPVGGAALDKANDALIAKALPIAAELLETAEGDISLDGGIFRMRSGNRTVTWTDVARAAHAKDGDLTAAGTWRPDTGSFPNGCHICEVEIDPETGSLRIDRYTIVDDVGVTLNPTLLKGQVIGGTVQGIGQALREKVIYDPETAQLLTGTLQDYALARADDFPAFDFSTRNVPCTTNPLGVKGAGEAGTIGATPTLVNAAFDALWDLGVRRLDMPLTPSHLWRTIQDAKSV